MPAVDGHLLLGWMEKDEAAYWLMNECLFPQPFSEAQVHELWDKYRRAVAGLPERNPKQPERLPIPPSLKAIVDNFLVRTRGPEVADVISVNPLDLLVYQLYVVADRADHHAKQLGGKEWAHCCLRSSRKPPRLGRLQAS